MKGFHSTSAKDLAKQSRRQARRSGFLDKVRDLGARTRLSENLSHSSVGSAKDYELPIREEALNAVFFMKRLLRYRDLALFSLPLDLLIVQLYFSMKTTPIDFVYLQNIFGGLTLLSLACLLFKQHLLSIRDIVGSIQRRFAFSEKNKHVWYLVGLLVVFELVSVLLKTEALRGKLLTIGLPLLLITGVSTVHMIREKRIHDQKFLQDKLLWLEKANTQVFQLNLAMLGIARSLSLVGAALAFAHSGWLAAYIPYCLFSTLMLFALSPDLQEFLANCSRCGRVTSRALRKAGLCPACDRRYFQVLHTLPTSHNAHAK